MSSTARTAGQGEAAAASKIGTGAKFLKWGGRAVMAIAIAADVYEIYNSNNKARTITVKAGAWGGAAAGATGGAEIGASIGTFFGRGIGTAVGGFFGGLIGGVGGYFVGEKVTETVYDYIFTKGVSAK